MTRLFAIRRAILLAALAPFVLLAGESARASRLSPPGADSPIDSAAGLRAFATQERSRPAAPRLPRADFLAQAMLRAARLSPDGGQVAALVDQSRTRSAWIASAAQPQGRRLLARTTADEIAWSRDGRWLFLVSPTQVYAQAMAGQRGSGAVAAVGGRGHREFAGVDPWLPAAVLLLERPPKASPLPKRWRLWRAQPGGQPRLLHESAREIVDFAFGRDGRPSHLSLAVGDGHVVLRRLEAGGWKALARCRLVQRCSFAGTADDGRALLLVSNHGADRLRLLQMDADGVRRTLHEDPRGEADLDELVLDPGDNRPRIVAYRSTVARNHGLDADARAAIARIDARFPNRNLRIEPGRGKDARWLVHERAPTLRGERLQLVDPRTGGAIELLPQLAFEHDGKPMPRPPESAMARQVAVSWTASDGMRLHGFLMLPPGVDPARAPLLVSVHGGPFNHLHPEWSTQAQFLANRGYIVFGPNFRSSTGFGRRYLFAGKGEFGGKGRVQQDIVEGTRWLLRHGIGDAGRVGMVGASYGGYATLLALSFSPELYKVGTASVPPSDFGRVVREYAGSAEEMVPGVPIAVSMRDLGVDPADAALHERLRAQSPIAHAAAMRRPLLVFAGGEDDRVPIRGVTHYAALLQSLGKDVTLFVDADAGHGLASDARTREAWFYLQETLLQRVLGGARPEPPGATLRAHLKRNLRLTGRSMK